MDSVSDQHEQQALNQELVKAAKRGDDNKIIELLSNGAQADYDNSLAVTKALGLGRINTAILLIENGGDIEARNYSGNTTFVLAVELNRIDAAKKLLELGANINAIDDFGQNALISISYHDSVDSAKFLLDNGIDCSTMDNEGNTALFIAETRKNINMVALIKAYQENDQLKSGIQNKLTDEKWLGF